MTNMDKLEELFGLAKEDDAKFIAVAIEMDGFPEPEIIVNPIENADLKLEYYKKTYDENLNHKFAEGVRIIICDYGDSLGEFNWINIKKKGLL